MQPKRECCESSLKTPNPPGLKGNTISVCGGSELPDAFDLCNAVVGDSGQRRDHLREQEKVWVSQETLLNLNDI